VTQHGAIVHGFAHWIRVGLKPERNTRNHVNFVNQQEQEIFILHFKIKSFQSLDGG
jgi:hypothetical protein